MDDIPWPASLRQPCPGEGRRGRLLSFWWLHHSKGQRMPLLLKERAETHDAFRCSCQFITCTDQRGWKYGGIEVRCLPSCRRRWANSRLSTINSAGVRDARLTLREHLWVGRCLCSSVPERLRGRESRDLTVVCSSSRHKTSRCLEVEEVLETEMMIAYNTR